MKRKLLPILSIACLVLAGVLLLGYAGWIQYGWKSVWPSGQTVCDSVSLGFGIISCGHLEEPTPNIDFGVGWEGRRPSLENFQLRNTLGSFGLQVKEPYGGPGTRMTAVMAPLWCAILPLLIPSLLWWRRRRRDRRAAVPGFPVATTQTAS